ncbi:uncharacterized protein RJT20DRAFT_126125 [Scheffersomyces xylosifermentans]|uniref:uncharacterized protein n=1 Tax=Scheffersomyces xylosifermentans TaxID=1304137 RepID=UPI00315C8C79
MSSQTSSPTRRSALSPKSSNISSPKRKHGSNPFGTPRLSPLKKTLPPRSSPSPKRPKLNFAIYEDKIEKPVEIEDSDVESISNEMNHNDQENILQPKKIAGNNSFDSRSNCRTGRVPLRNLNIYEFPGHYSSSSHSTTQLTELYQPATFNNEFKSVHKYVNIPCFLTPSRRSNKEQYMVRSSSGNFDEEAIDEEIDESDLTLERKHQQQLKRQPGGNHKRSYSVGKNDGKLPLIRKNNFTILSS